MEIREADIAVMGRAAVEELIDRAVRPDVPLRVLFAALDRYTELLRPALADEPGPPAEAAPPGRIDPATPTARPTATPTASPTPAPAPAPTSPAATVPPGPSGPAAVPDPHRPPGPPGPPRSPD
ncbi:hypothetical protein [Catenulispora pinisilvae]|uniref:hypothetical protein n=1 Tax=Catenulispora pinisilvae TaxID=2705253 RepID=UPI0018910DF9|nr:hypothetical protein [Catenulispora pinisilvae]